MRSIRLLAVAVLMPMAAWSGPFGLTIEVSAFGTFNAEAPLTSLTAPDDMWRVEFHTFTSPPVTDFDADSFAPYFWDFRYFLNHQAVQNVTFSAVRFYDLDLQGLFDVVVGDDSHLLTLALFGMQLYSGFTSSPLIQMTQLKCGGYCTAEGGGIFLDNGDIFQDPAGSLVRIEPWSAGEPAEPSSAVLVAAGLLVVAVWKVAMRSARPGGCSSRLGR